MKSLKWVPVALVALLLAGALVACGEEAVRDDSSKTTAADKTTAAAKPSKPKSKWRQVRDGLEDQYGKRIKEITREGNAIVVGVKAEDNFTNGLILGGMDRDSGDTFKLIYNDVGMHPREVLVQGYLPLTDTKTGKESEDVVTVHALKRAEAEQIDWDNADAIQWDSYRTFKHPALD